MSTTVDIIVLVFLLLGALNGFRKGIIKSVISFVGIIIAILIAWYLKNPISEFMYTKLPFINFTGNLALYNIVVYELIAFLVIVILLLVVLRLIIITTGLIDKIIGFATGLGFISKLLGLIFGLIESYVIAFIVLFLMYNFTTLNTVMDQNSISTKMLESTPVLSDIIKDEFNSLEEISSLTDNYKEGTKEYNQELFKILLKYEVIKKETAQNLIDNNKINFEGAQEVLNQF